jgi:lipid A ethanolaminephosphotransferase
MFKNRSQTKLESASLYLLHPVWAALGLSLYVLFSANLGVIKSAFSAGGAGINQQVIFMVAVSAIVVFWQASLWLLIAPTRWARTLALIWIAVSVIAGYLQQKTGVVLDPSMLRNALRTDWHEARELISIDLLLRCFIFTGLAWVATRHVRIQPLASTWWRAILSRLGWAGLGLGLTVALILSVMQPLASWMRNDKAARYLITPSNVLWSGSVALFQDAQVAAKPRQSVALDARAGAMQAQRKKPMVVIMVVGETARAANWGLNAAVYPQARDTTPELKKLNVINFPRVEACGTNTEVSLPCMFSFLGRKNYDEDLIRTQDSVLHVLARTGVNVHWRDNQSGCKGVCAGLPQDTLDAKLTPKLCEGGRCLDEALMADLDARLANAQGTQLWLFHQLGNHGPAYYRRYPPQFSHFQPACQSDDLQRCTLAEITNAYDNALRYTDHILAETIRKLQAKSELVDSALIYVSDHGESLGEKGLFLHGMPRAIAPREQLEVPMIAWFSAGMDAARGGEAGCLQREFARTAQNSLSHDYLTHTLLGLFDVQTSSREAAFDLTRDCNAAQAKAKAGNP